MNIFLLGVSRVGKSTTAQKLVKKNPNYKIISLDIIINAYKKTFNDTQIGYSKEYLENNKLALLVLNIINQFDHKKDPPFIIEGDSILSEEYHQFFESKNNIVFFLINKKTATEKVADCRKYDNINDWTAHMDDEQILKHFNEDNLIQEKIIQQANIYNYPIIEVTQNREQILEDLLEKISQKIEKKSTESKV